VVLKVLKVLNRWCLAVSHAPGCPRSLSTLLN
jgi:hypothetical protein